ncbi:vacuolar sorting protein DID4 [Mycena amicta]|nr:vacuolar sorting protein DID4 [Mycena amicta]
MNLIEFLFGWRVTPAERLRQYQRALAKARRELERERNKLAASEKKLIADIKHSAKDGQLQACRVMARDLLRNRRYVANFYQMGTRLQAVSLHIQTLRSNQQMADAMRGATRAMTSMNRSLNLPAMQRIMTEFEKESSMMEMKDDMVSGFVDDLIVEDDEEELEGERILKEVLDEIGVDLSHQLKDAPTGIASASVQLANRQPVALGEIAGPAPTGGGDSGAAGGDGGMDEEDALQARLDTLRRG